jgi:lipopolysaccharide/colanic/teichoic acid biosynthesis glycosyltransferase
VRAFDIVAATLGLVLCSPLLALAALAIRIETPGSPIYRQWRVGKDGAVFELFKLRTMVHGVDPVGIGTAVARDDPRVTRVGRVLRRLSFDEVPNLVNVLRGEMAIVGPRPTIEAQVAEYSPTQRRRLEARPGITGWAQVNGRVELPWEERIELDVWYVDHRSAWLDVKILLRTSGLLVSGRGLTSGGG